MSQTGLKRLFPQGLFGRSMLIIITPLIVVQLVSTYIFFTGHWDTVARRLAAGLAGDVGAVVEALRAFPHADDRHIILKTIALRMELNAEFIEDAILPNLPQRPPSTIMERALFHAMNERVRRPFTVDNDRDERVMTLQVQMADGVLRVVASRKRLYTSTTYVFVLWMVGTSLLLLSVATLFMRNQVRSVRRLAAAADSFGKGLDVPDFKPEGAAEVRQAAHAFNQMRARIRRQLQQRTEMLAGVSHDLRTPLTRMKLQMAMMGANDGLDELNEDVAEMERMVEGYLAFARGEGTEQPIPSKLGELVDQVVARFRREGRTIDLHIEDEVTMGLRPNALSRALSNLIGNALRYGGHVWVRVGRRDDAAEIMIDDDGPGIPAHQREEVFKAFTRLEGSRNVQTGGVGLGLTIARDIARGHGGDVVLEDSPLGGLRARVRLPL